MSAIKTLIAFLFFNTLQAQDWEGTYNGSLISKENAISISLLNKSMAFGTLYLNRENKKFFNGVIDEKMLRAKIKLDKEELELIAILNQDSLNLTIYSIVKDSAVERYQGNFLRVSNDPKYKISKVLSESKAEHDPRLIGRWRLIKFIKSGSETILTESFEVEYAIDGETRMISAVAEKVETQYRRLTGKVVPRYSMTWKTSEDKLITTTRETGKSTTQFFVISADTLITNNEIGIKAYYLRKK